MLLKCHLVILSETCIRPCPSAYLNESTGLSQKVIRPFEKLFCFGFLYLERLNGKIRKCLFFQVNIFCDNLTHLLNHFYLLSFQSGCVSNMTEIFCWQRKRALGHNLVSSYFCLFIFSGTPFLPGGPWWPFLGP